MRSYVTKVVNTSIFAEFMNIISVRNSIFTLLFVGLIGCSSAHSQKKTKTTQKDPDTPAQYVQQATFTTFNGEKVSLSDYKGKVVMIDFWETWCKPCIDSFSTLEKLQKEYPKKFKVLAVNPGFSDSKSDAETFAKNHDYTFTYLLDSGDLHSKLNIQGIPYKVFVDPSGKFIKTMMGSHGPEADYRSIKSVIEKHS
ncbi:MAG TPA: TlpA disulfide reductase family protein [Balneolaceae bacterium]|nr:TlpA disulfide reductase family protein [Balneolaceae bacterium]